VTAGDRPGSILADDHAFKAFDWRPVEVEGADWAVELAVTPRVTNGAGALQGGLLATLADMAAGSALLHGDDPYVRTATSELHVSYLAAARVGPVRAVAHVLRRGRRMAVVRVDAYDLGAGGLHVAAATLTFAVSRAGRQPDGGGSPEHVPAPGDGAGPVGGGETG
jgi:uncharacterized protein (TIGR00369 family)